mgnify:FL=1
MCFGRRDPEPLPEPERQAKIVERSSGVHLLEVHFTSVGMTLSMVLLFVAAMLLVMCLYRRFLRKWQRRPNSTRPQQEAPRQPTTTPSGLPPSLATLTPEQLPFLSQNQNNTYPYQANLEALTLATSHLNPLIRPFQHPYLTALQRLPVCEHRLTELPTEQAREPRPVNRTRAPSPSGTTSTPRRRASGTTQTPLTRA